MLLLLLLLVLLLLTLLLLLLLLLLVLFRLKPVRFILFSRGVLLRFKRSRGVLPRPQWRRATASGLRVFKPWMRW